MDGNVTESVNYPKGWLKVKLGKFEFEFSFYEKGKNPKGLEERGRAGSVLSGTAS